MRSVVAAALVLVLLAFLLPLLFWSEAPMAAQAEPGGRPAALPVSSAGREAADPAPAAGSWDSVTSLQVYLSEEETVTLTMSDYLWRVVAAEMPASFEPEALKAQAVAARTYTAARLDRVHTRHPDAALCGNSACCQAYIEPADAAARWGGSAAVYTERIAAAVADTDGMVILYDGVPIDAVFHSSSAGRTMDAVAVWGGSVPYLTGVESPEGDEVPGYRSSVRLPVEEVRDTLSAAWPERSFSGDPLSWFDSLDPNRVRALLSLRSSHFTVAPEGDTLEFSVTGYGHGVGMSQYGANALAAQGKDYKEILTWYYTGVTIERYG